MASVPSNSLKPDFIPVAGQPLQKDISGEIGNGSLQIFGKNVLNKQNVVVNIDENKNILFIGSIGSGKTNAIMHVVNVLRKKMTSEDVMIIFDTKGDYIEEFYKENDIVIANRPVLNVKKRKEYTYAQWNLFNDISIDKEWMDEAIIEVTRTLYESYQKGAKDPFFINAASNVTSGVIRGLLRDKNNPNNADLFEYLYNKTREDLSTLLLKFPELKGTQEYIAKDGGQSQGILSTIKIMIEDIFNSSFKRPGDFSIRQFIRDKWGKALFIEYDFSTGKIITPIYRLLMDFAIKESLGRRKSSGNVYFIIDEFSLLPNLYHIEDAINFGRSLGVHFIIGSQNVEQVYNSYGETRGRSILGAFGSTFSFRLYDKVSKDFISDRYGAILQIIKIPTHIANDHIRNNYLGKVIEDWHIASLSVGVAIGSLPDYAAPFLFQFNEYHAKMGLIICPNCHLEVEETIFCSNCGFQLQTSK